jgi:hypothetical protein
MEAAVVGPLLTQRDIEIDETAALIARADIIRGIVLADVSGRR